MPFDRCSGRMYGLIGGPERSRVLTPEQRSNIASKAGHASVASKFLPIHIVKRNTKGYHKEFFHCDWLYVRTGEQYTVSKDNKTYVYDQSSDQWVYHED